MNSTKKTLIQILEEEPFLMTDKNIVHYKKYNDTYPWMQFHSYIEHFYEDAFREYQNRSNVKVCEIGIDVGGSISLLSKYFINGDIFGIDIHTNRLSEDNEQNKFNNVTYLIHDAYNTTFIDSLPMFDIIIDDGPHTFDSMLIFIEHYIHKLNNGGLMVIEDIPNYEWIQYLKYFLPPNINTDIIDLRNTDYVEDSLLLSIKK
jgi:SAM-dependent methyltransferase